MRKKIGVLILTGAFALTALPPVALAAQGGRMSGQSQQLKTQQQIRSQQRLRDGSGGGAVKAGSGVMQKRGNTYGPGDGTGNAGIGPKDGTGYGAPSK